MLLLGRSKTKEKAGLKKEHVSRGSTRKSDIDLFSQPCLFFVSICKNAGRDDSRADGCRRCSATRLS